MAKKWAYILLLTLTLSGCGGVSTSVHMSAPPDAEAETRSLTAQELDAWSAFFRQEDCYGFLMSSYETPLDADLGQVFYTGAGSGQSPSAEMVEAYLTAEGFDEAYTDITFISADDVNAVLERRTGYALEHFQLLGHDLPMYYSAAYGGYFHMAGDTNYMAVECTSGEEAPDGSITLESREKPWGGDDGIDSGICEFRTTLQPDGQGNYVFESNVVKSGWLLWYQELGPEADED